MDGLVQRENQLFLGIKHCWLAVVFGSWLYFEDGFGVEKTGGEREKIWKRDVRFCLRYISIPVTKHYDQGDLQKTAFNLGAHSSGGLEFMTITAGKQTWCWSSHSNS